MTCDSVERITVVWGYVSLRFLKIILCVPSEPVPLYGINPFLIVYGFPGGSDGKESACDAGDPCSIPGPGRSPGEGNGDPL